MKISQNGLNLIKQFEGCRLQAYKDVAGVPTIGYGHTSGVKMGQTITQAQADAFLKNDVAIFEQRVDKYNGIYHFTQNEFDALVSFCYNIGNIKELTNDGRLPKNQIPNVMLKYVYAGGRVIKGLQNRRAKEVELFKKSAPAPAPAPAPIGFKVGKNYTLQVNVIVRTKPSKSAPAVGHRGLTADGRKHDKDKNGSLDKGTVITCKDVRVENGNVWLKCPSGWLAAIYNGEVLIK